DEEDIELVINHTFRFTEKIQQLRDQIQDGLIGDIHAVNAQFRMELMRNSTHLIDTLDYFLDLQPKYISGYITGENEAVDALDADIEVDDAGGGGIIITKDDTFVTIDCTVPRDASSMCYQIIGSEGKLYLNNDDSEWRYWTLDDGEHIEKDLPQIGGTWTWTEDYRRGFPNAAAHVVDLLDGKTQNISSGKDALLSLKVIIAFFVSHATGSRVTF
ncbi:MAG: Gfo/Idh/MocA family oxidoreductase, partial [Halobacteriaceae archaeon]